jgi:hypothetical protein
MTQAKLNRKKKNVHAPVIFLHHQIGCFQKFFSLCTFSNETWIRKTNSNKIIIRHTSYPNDLDLKETNFLHS